MPVRIRLSRGGAKKRPFYRIVVADSRRSRDGKFIDQLGTYNPMLQKDNPERVKIDVDKVSDVTIDTEDTADAKIEFQNGTKANVHVDYLQEDYTRYFKFGDKKYNIKPTDSMYMNEAIYFLNHIKNMKPDYINNKRCMNNLEDAVYLIDKIKLGVKNNVN